MKRARWKVVGTYINFSLCIYPTKSRLHALYIHLLLQIMQNQNVTQHATQEKRTKWAEEKAYGTVAFSHCRKTFMPPTCLYSWPPPPPCHAMQTIFTIVGEFNELSTIIYERTYKTCASAVILLLLLLPYSSNHKTFLSFSNMKMQKRGNGFCTCTQWYATLLGQ